MLNYEKSNTTHLELGWRAPTSHYPEFPGDQAVNWSQLYDRHFHRFPHRPVASVCATSDAMSVVHQHATNDHDHANDVDDGRMRNEVSAMCVVGVYWLWWLWVVYTFHRRNGIPHRNEVYSDRCTLDVWWRSFVIVLVVE